MRGIIGVPIGLLLPAEGESGSSWGGGSGKPGHGVDDVGQGCSGLGGREALQGCQRSVSVAAAEVDGRSHTFAGLDRFPQLSENTGTTGWVLAVPARTIISESTGLPPPLPEVKARTAAVRQSSQNILYCSILAPHYNTTAGNLNYITHYFIT